MLSGKSSINKMHYASMVLSSAKKVALNTNKELAERHLDVSPGQGVLNHGATTGRHIDHRSIAAKVVMGSHLIDFDTDEICPLHKGEMLIARDEQDADLYGCNKCVFERKLQKPVFLVHQAKLTKNQIDTRYQQLTTNLSEANELEPD
jgi:hypothetical protein